ncbi:hypothetical protein B0G62_10594 [Paraburkholderia eburnea]|uniref:Uncharacterized protein n=1 Tax=Paraburkholderia eburnea TaxID=1189126 RepID=A0A2S4MBK7_9BURK|nr:hypothetical protein [Paraburkholderia eburnea]POR52126.1 hypothetical protein B0G62_10594 [Paraburkholderia eburnea]PRZ23017.1 hypothetical protein BX588_10594 [Paraburkholderia eburnea]
MQVAFLDSHVALLLAADNCAAQIGLSLAWTADAWAEIDLVWNDDQHNPAVDRFRDFVLTRFATAVQK